MSIKTAWNSTQRAYSDTKSALSRSWERSKGPLFGVGLTAFLVGPMAAETYYYTKDEELRPDGSCNLTFEEDGQIHAHVTSPVFGEIGNIILEPSNDGTFTGRDRILGHNYDMSVDSEGCHFYERNAPTKLFIGDITVHVERSDDQTFTNHMLESKSAVSKLEL